MELQHHQDGIDHGIEPKPRHQLQKGFKPNMA
jgi:hypothetical protein